MKRDKVVATYGRHRKRVVAVEPAWTARDNIFSSSSDSYHSQSSHLVDHSNVFSPEKENECEISWLAEKGGGRQARKKDFGTRRAAKKKTNTENVFDTSEDTSDPSFNYTTSKRVLKDKNTNLTAFGSSNISNKIGKSVTKTRHIKNPRRTIDPKKQNPQKKTIVTKEGKSDSSDIPCAYNFSDFDKYSLIISDSPPVESGGGVAEIGEDHAAQNASPTIASTEQCAKRNPTEKKTLSPRSQKKKSVESDLRRNILSHLYKNKGKHSITPQRDHDIDSSAMSPVFQESVNEVKPKTASSDRLLHSSTPLAHSSTPLHNKTTNFRSLNESVVMEASYAVSDDVTSDVRECSQGLDQLHLSSVSSIAASPQLAYFSATSKNDPSLLKNSSGTYVIHRESCRVELTRLSLEEKSHREPSHLQRGHLYISTPKQHSFESRHSLHRYSRGNSSICASEGSSNNQYETCGSTFNKRISTGSKKSDRLSHGSNTSRRYDVTHSRDVSRRTDVNNSHDASGVNKSYDVTNSRDVSNINVSHKGYESGMNTGYGSRSKPNSSETYIVTRSMLKEKLNQQDQTNVLQLQDTYDHSLSLFEASSFNRQQASSKKATEQGQQPKCQLMRQDIQPLHLRSSLAQALGSKLGMALDTGDSGANSNRASYHREGSVGAASFNQSQSSAGATSFQENEGVESETDEDDLSEIEELSEQESDDGDVRYELTGVGEEEYEENNSDLKITSQDGDTTEEHSINTDSDATEEYSINYENKNDNCTANKHKSELNTPSQLSTLPRNTQHLFSTDGKSDASTQSSQTRNTRYQTRLQQSQLSSSLHLNNTSMNALDSQLSHYMDVSSQFSITDEDDVTEDYDTAQTDSSEHHSHLPDEQQQLVHRELTEISEHESEGDSGAGESNEESRDVQDEADLSRVENSDEIVQSTPPDLPCKTPVRTQRESIINDLCNSMKVLTPVRTKRDGLVLSAREKVLMKCDQTEPIPFSKCFTPTMLRKSVKIGEGVYGEVFKTERRKKSVAMKVIPIEGSFPVNDEPQKSFAEMLPEIVISQELSDLRESEDNMSSNFVNVLGVSIVQGKYPSQLLKQWDIFHQKKGSENDRPDMFDDEQLFVVFEFEECGSDLEGFEFTDLAQAKSTLLQVALALAIGESALQLEHRDLHWGNVLVKSTREQTLDCVLSGNPISIATGCVKVAIIDFTLSRLFKDGCAVFCDLSEDPTIFLGQGDYQFDVYRLMKEENKNDWKPFRPYTNVLWLHYLADKLIKMKTYPNAKSREHKAKAREFRTFLRDALSYQSALHLVTECPFFANSY